MRKNIELSIITICLNNKKGLKKTLESLYRQVYKEMEVWVIDGGSKDGSLDVIKYYKEKFNNKGQNFSFISEPDTGRYNAMNKGIQNANGKWVVFMNSGDIPSSEHIYEDILHSNSYKNYDILYGDCILSGKGKQKLSKAKSLITIRKSLPFCHQAVITRTDLLKNRKYDETFKIAADYEWYLNAYLGKRRFLYIEKPFCIYDVSGVSSVEIYKTYKEFIQIRNRHGVDEDMKIMKYCKLFVWFLIDKTSKLKGKVTK